MPDRTAGMARSIGTTSIPDWLQSRPVRPSVVPDLLATAALVLPLVVVTALADAFVLPKLLALLLLSAVLVAAMALERVTQGPPDGQPADRVAALRDAGDRATWVARIALVALLGSLALATVLSADRARSLVGEPEQYQGLGTMLAYAIGLLAAWRALGDRGPMRRVIRAIVLAGAATATYGIAQLAGYDPLWSSLYEGTIFATFGNRNELGAYLALALPLAAAAAAMPAPARRDRLAAAVAVPLIGLALLLTFSRGAYLGAALALAVVLVLGRRWGRDRRTMRALGAGALALVVAITAVAFVPPVRELADRVVDRALTSVDRVDPSVEDRFDLWTVAVAMVVDHPVTGIGPEMYPVAYPDYAARLLPPDRQLRPGFVAESPHNVPLAIAVAAGIPALLAYLVLVGAVLWLGVRAAVRSSGPDRVLLAGLVAALCARLATDLFTTADVAGTWTAWLLMGAILATSARTRQPGQASPASDAATTVPSM